MEIYNLAKRITEFVYNNCDWYELHDCYDSYEEFESETYMGLCNQRHRKGIMDYLREMEMERARLLADEVSAL